MVTVVAVSADGGVALASDTLAVEGGGVTSENAQQLYEFDDAVVGAVGDRGDVDEFARRVSAELKQVDAVPGREPTASAVARIAADAAADLGIDALVAARDEAGEATVHQVDSTGGVVSVERGAIGSGASLAIGYMENADAPAGLDGARTLAEESVAAAQDVDPESGGDVDVAALADRE